jgi:hypothetical protein
LDENTGPVSVELTPEDMRNIDVAASKIMVQGAPCPALYAKTHILLVMMVCFCSVVDVPLRRPSRMNHFLGGGTSRHYFRFNEPP